MQYAAVIQTSIGALTAVEQDGKLAMLKSGDFSGGYAVEKTPLLALIERELNAYFAGSLKAFTVPLAASGTPFQQKVWAALRDIPYGETRTYAQVAKEVGSPRGFRAVGMANHNNPVMILTPCHRVIGTDGSLTGYAGGLDAKRALLDLESKFGAK
jgi:methylated-DNA-[protein]-cysteine S-methyltransferase